MNLFYLRHHYQSTVRSNSFDGEVFAFFLLAIMFGGSISLAYDQLEPLASSVSLFFSQDVTNYQLFLMLYIFSDLGVRLAFRRPLPKLKYYVLWINASRQIAAQYLITSLFGIMPFFLAISMFMLASKANEWMGVTASISVIVWCLACHFIGLISQFAHSKARVIITAIIFIILLIQWLVPGLDIGQFLIDPLLAGLILIIAISISFFRVKSVIEKGEIKDEKGSSGILDALPALNFKNPVFQLEWALLVRNKRTRSNLLLGIAAMLVVPFVMDVFESLELFLVFGFLVTGFFLLQHGIYSYQWESSFFDFFISNVDIKKFLHARWNFYAIISLFGLMLLIAVALFYQISLTYAFSIFLFNIGVIIPVVLYRATFHKTRMELSDSISSTYQGMITGPILFTSHLVLFIPVVFYVGIGMLLQQSEPLFLGLVGLLGLILKRPLVNFISGSFRKRKYHLSQSFKA